MGEPAKSNQKTSGGSEKRKQRVADFNDIEALLEEDSDETQIAMYERPKVPHNYGNGKKVPRSNSWWCCINNPRKIFGKRGDKMTPEQIVQELGKIIAGKNNARNVLINFEKGLKEGTEHCHVCVESASYIRATTLDKLFPAKGVNGKQMIDSETGEKLYWLFDHKFTRGTAQSIYEYMNKTGRGASKEESLIVKPVLFGDNIIGKPGSGGFNKKDLDLSHATEMIMRGKTPTDVYLEEPNYLFAATQIEKFYEIWTQENQPTKWEMNVIWCCGYSGTRKSSYLEEVERIHGRRNVYMVQNIADHPWDSYESEPVIFIDEFRDSQISFANLLGILIGLRGKLAARYRNREKCFHTVYITSIKLPCELYRNVVDDVDNLTQLTRRVSSYRWFWRSKNGEYHSEEFPATISTTRMDLESQVLSIDPDAVFEAFVEDTWEEHLRVKESAESTIESNREYREQKQLRQAQTNYQAMFGALPSTSPYHTSPPSSFGNRGFDPDLDDETPF